MKEITPAEQGEMAAKRIIFLAKLCDEFKSFVTDSWEHSEDFEDHLEFLSTAMEAFIDHKEGDE